MDANPAGDYSQGARALKRYWTRGPGLAKWKNAPHPWTTLSTLLTKYMSPERAKRTATIYYVAVFGYGPGSDRARVRKGLKPRGKVVGPG